LTDINTVEPGKRLVILQLIGYIMRGMGKTSGEQGEGSGAGGSARDLENQGGPAEGPRTLLADHPDLKRKWQRQPVN
jgi:hypothetical protein